MLKSFFYNDKINDLISHVVVPSYEENSGETFWFENDVADYTSDWPCADVVRASMMAPGFFDSLIIGDSEFSFEFKDGGVAYNNPAKHMLSKLIYEGADLENIFILSLGTGKTQF